MLRRWLNRNCVKLLLLAIFVSGIVVGSAITTVFAESSEPEIPKDENVFVIDTSVVKASEEQVIKLAQPMLSVEDDIYPVKMIGNESFDSWWLRSRYTSSTFWCVSSDGSTYYGYASISAGVCFGFCV